MNYRCHKYITVMSMKTINQFKIYKILAQELGIMFPLKESELTTPINPIPNTLEFDLKNFKKLGRDEVESRRMDRTKAYYKVYKKLGSEEFEKLTNNKESFKIRSKEHSDRYVNLHTIISILYLSGFRDDELIDKSINYLLK